MSSDDLIKRMQALNKGPLKNVPHDKRDEQSDLKALRRKLGKQASARKQIDAQPQQAQVAQDPIVYSRTVTTTACASVAPPARCPIDFGPPVALDEVIEGTLIEASCGPGCYLIELPAHELEAEARLLHRRFESLTGYPDGQAVRRLAAVCESERVCPQEIVFLDIETTGLAMTPLFLIGTMECTPDGFCFKQYFARDYTEEASVISATSDRLASTQLLVTFNGKSFDMPFIQNRAAATGVRLAEPAYHLDLLHEARKSYRRDLPNCKLQTLEQMVCGRCREDDIPGSEIPAAYHEFVRTGNANKISLILQHNLFDLLTMADLMSRMWGRE